jgi:hypothetical protein
MARYESFILRIWQSGGTGGAQWAGKVQKLPDGENLRFADPDALLDYLRTVLFPIAAPSQAPEPHSNVIHFGREGRNRADEQSRDSPEV